MIGMVKGMMRETKTVAGLPSPIASFRSNASGVKLDSLKVLVEAQQDLHGYDYPWAGGAGKNKLSFTSGKTHTENGITFLVDDDGSTKVTSNGASTGGSFFNYYTLNLPVGTYYLYALENDSVWSYSASGKFRLYVAHDGAGINFGNTLTVSDASKNVVVYVQAFANKSYNDTVKLMICEGSSAPTAWTPYENICPITGWSGCDVTRTGANVWDEEWENGYWNVANGQPVANYSYIRCKNFLSVKPNTTYCLSNSSTTSVNNEVLFFDVNKNLLSPSYTDVKGNATFTTPANCYFIKFYMNINYGRTYNNDISINYPSTDTEYHPFVGNPYSSFFEGLINGTMGFVDLGTLTWDYTTSYTKPLFFADVSGKKINNANIVCPIFNNMGIITNPNTFSSIGDKIIGSSSSTQRIFVRDDSFTDATEFTTAMSGIYLIYELATPTTPTITQAQMDTLVKAFGVEKMSAIFVFGDTYYGGELDVTNGVLRVTHQIEDLGNLNYTKYDVAEGTLFRTQISGAKLEYNVNNLLCSAYHFALKEQRANGTYSIPDNVGNLDFINNSYSDATAFKTAMAGQKLVYELATPIEIQLTSQQIEQLEENNIWADTGDVSECVYQNRIVTKLFSKG